MVYIEAVVGLRYTWFLRRHNKQYRFRANPYNIDGYYGWATIRKAFTFMLAGVATTTLSLYPVYLFVRAAVPLSLLVILLLSYEAVVLYVSIASAIILRGHVRQAKQDGIQRLIADLRPLDSVSSVEDLLRQQLLTNELRDYRDIPSFPVTSRWTALAAMVGLIGLLASLAQIISVLRT